MCEFLFAVPPAALLAAFDHQFYSIIERVISVSEESSLLGSLRDTLLPRLISGELRIPDAERMLAEAGI